MSQYDNTNSGALFKNSKRTEENNQPNYTGNINVEGVDKRLAAWVKVSKKGETYISLLASDALVSENTEKPKKAGSIQPLSSSLEEMVVVTDEGETTEKPEKNPFLEEQDIPF